MHAAHRVDLWKFVVWLMMAGASFLPVRADIGEIPAPPTAMGSRLRVIAPGVLEIELIEAETPVENGMPRRWNFAIPAAALKIPAPSQFAVTAGGVAIPVREVGL